MTTYHVDEFTRGYDAAIQDLHTYVHEGHRGEAEQFFLNLALTRLASRYTHHVLNWSDRAGA